MNFKQALSLYWTLYIPVLKIIYIDDKKSKRNQSLFLIFSSLKTGKCETEAGTR